MNMRLLSVILLIAVGSSVHATAYELGPLRIEHAWSRATPKGATLGAGYLTITNTGSLPDRLTGASLADAEQTQVHQMTTEDGVMRMRPLPNGVEIAPGQSVEFKPNGVHLMFMGLKHPLLKGELVKGKLTFERAGSVDIEFAVEAAGAASAPADNRTSTKDGQ